MAENLDYSSLLRAVIRGSARSHALHLEVLDLLNHSLVGFRLFDNFFGEVLLSLELDCGQVDDEGGFGDVEGVFSGACGIISPFSVSLPSASSDFLYSAARAAFSNAIGASRLIFVGVDSMIARAPYAAPDARKVFVVLSVGYPGEGGDEAFADWLADFNSTLRCLVEASVSGSGPESLLRSISDFHQYAV